MIKNTFASTFRSLALAEPGLFTDNYLRLAVICRAKTSNYL